MTFLVEINKLITNLYINSLGKKQRNIHGKFANIKAYQPGNGFKTQVSIERRLQSLRGRSHQEHLGLLPEHTHTHKHTHKYNCLECTRTPVSCNSKFIKLSVKQEKGKHKLNI